MAVEKWTPERRRQLTRDALLEAAAAVFAQRGFHGASLDEIAETAGFTRGAIYKNFTDKEDLFLAVNEKFNERMLQEFGDLLTDTGPADNLAEVTAKWREMQANNRDLYILGAEFNLYLIRNPEKRERAVERIHEGTRRVARFMEERAESAGVEMPIPAEELATMFLVTSDGFNMASLIDPDVARLYGVFLELFTLGVFGNAFAGAEAPKT